MNTMLRFSTRLVAMSLVLLLGWGVAALAQTQVSSFPYPPYNWTGAISLSSTNGGDGNYRADQTHNASAWNVKTTGGIDDGPCAQVGGFKGNGEESYLDLVLNTSGIPFGGGERYYFSVAVNVVPEGEIGTIRVQENSSGSFENIAGSERDLSTLSTTYSTYLDGVALPDGMENKASVTLRIVVRSTSQTVKTATVTVDNNEIRGGALPIQLASSAAYVIRDNDVEVAWRTVSETNNYGYEIYRKRGESGDWTKIGFVQGSGTTLAPQSYSYVDRSLSFGKYSYRLKQVDLDGQSKDYSAMEVTVGVADRFVLAQNYPNPFNPSTMIEFVVPQSGFATMKVYNVLGQEVATLFEGNADAGKVYTARFNASNLPSGLYFYTLNSAGKIETKRMLLLK